MKKVIATLLSAVLFVSIAAVMSGCGNENTDTVSQETLTADTNMKTQLSDADIKEAQTSFENLLASIKAVDMESAGKYLDTGKLVNSDDVDSLEGGDELLAAVFSKMEYQMGSAVANDDGTVMVIADVTTIDLLGVLGQCTNIVMTEMFEGKVTEDQVDARTEEIFKEEIVKDGLPTVKNQAIVKVKKMDGVWKTEVSESFINAISGGFLGSMAKAQESMKKG